MEKVKAMTPAQEPLKKMFRSVCTEASAEFLTHLKEIYSKSIETLLHTALNYAARVESKTTQGELRKRMAPIQVEAIKKGLSEKQIVEGFQTVYCYLKLISKWIFKGEPTFFVVREPWLLRALAVGNKSIVPLIKQLIYVRGYSQLQFSRESVMATISNGRIERYIKLFHEFVRRDLASSRKKLHFSGALDRNLNTKY
jgi:hypothetical protein